jgi:hypothetical protein
MKVVFEGNIGKQNVKVRSVVGRNDIGLFPIVNTLSFDGVNDSCGKQNPVCPNFLEAPCINKPRFSAKQYQKNRIEWQEKKESAQEKPKTPYPAQ